MELRFIGQGYNPEVGTSVAQALIDSLADNTFHSFKCLVAFASYAGITGLTTNINNSRQHIHSARVVVGIDQLGTSKEALEALMDWNVDAFVFNTKSSIIFHPKIYIFEGDENVKIIIGSNNLTQTGLSQNIEGSVEISFSKNEQEGMKLLEEITLYYDPLFMGTHANLEPISLELIEKLVNEGKVPTEAERRSQYNKKLSEISEEETNEPSEEQTIIFPSLPIQPIAPGFTPARLSKIAPVFSTSPLTPIIAAPAVPVLVNPEWNFIDTSQVLVVEIGGPGRWTQISFAKANFETFFMLPTNVGGSGQINLKYIETNGNLQNDVEIVTSAKVKASSNYNLEPAVVRACTVPYNSVNRPIVFFIKTDNANFIYHFETNGTPLYNQLNVLLGARNGNFLRRKITTVTALRAACPSFTI